MISALFSEGNPADVFAAYLRALSSPRTERYSQQVIDVAGRLTNESSGPHARYFFGDNRFKPDEMQLRLRVTAKLIRDDDLPECGREFVAELLETIANGTDIKKVVHSKRKHAPSDPSVLSAVERERLKRNAAHGEMHFVYEFVGRRLNLSASTTRKQASTARSWLRSFLAKAIADGQPRGKWISQFAVDLELPAAHIETMFKDVQ